MNTTCQIIATEIDSSLQYTHLFNEMNWLALVKRLDPTRNFQFAKLLCKLMGSAWELLFRLYRRPPLSSLIFHWLN